VAKSGRKEKAANRGNRNDVNGKVEAGLFEVGPKPKRRRKKILKKKERIILPIRENCKRNNQKEDWVAFVRPFGAGKGPIQDSRERGLPATPAIKRCLPGLAGIPQREALQKKPPVGARPLKNQTLPVGARKGAHKRGHFIPRGGARSRGDPLHVVNPGGGGKPLAGKQGSPKKT